MKLCHQRHLQEYQLDNFEITLRIFTILNSNLSQLKMVKKQFITCVATLGVSILPCDQQLFKSKKP
jgi:hypothetical protein